MGGDKNWIGADPFSDEEEPADVGDDLSDLQIPHLPPTATPKQRRSLVSELRSLVEQGEYEVEPEIVALAVMKEGRMVDHPLPRKAD